jgi:hypothetical protein
MHPAAGMHSPGLVQLVDVCIHSRALYRVHCKHLYFCEQQRLLTLERDPASTSHRRNWPRPLPSGEHKRRYREMAAQVMFDKTPASDAWPLSAACAGLRPPLGVPLGVASLM